ncbi:MAG: hypothetical protein P4M11_11540 [Candidatus Pacebacteria bacterium]|nr:hypothetical protein [Candidatus Paceibacterota bacterium]
MNIEDLSKSQLLMLTLLVNFVTSIATGVLTVSLLDQAPATVTQTVNQIVDHTIETIATSTPLATIVAPPSSVTKTVIQTADQLLPAAITNDEEHTVSIYGSAGTTTPLITQGTYLPKARAVATATQPGFPTEVTIEFPDGSTQMASLSHEGATMTIYGFSDTATLPKAPASSIIDHTMLKQGQTVVAITADGSAVTGIISKVDDTGVHTNLPAIPVGTAVVDLSGNVDCISEGVAGICIPADKITTLLTATPTAPGS